MKTTKAMDAAMEKVAAGNVSGVSLQTLCALRDRGLITLSIVRGRKTTRGRELTVEATLVTK